MEQNDVIDVFKALADPTRRQLLDALFEQDGQTLSQLEARFSMTRFGVMKHLQILEDARLLTTRKVGREKMHYLNPVPIQAVYERWVSKYAQPWANALLGLKSALEGEGMSAAPTHVFEIYIRTTPERLWQALTEGEMTRQYYFGSAVASSWQPGAGYHYPNPEGGDYIAGEILECDPPRRLVATFRPLWLVDTTDAVATPPTLVRWEIEPMGDVCKLTLVHEGLAPDTALTRDIIEGWGKILSGLKTLLETGQPLGVR